MRRITFFHKDGASDVWQAESASYGDASRNAILRNARIMEINLPDAETKYLDRTQRPAERVLIPLQEVLYLTESEW